VHRFVASKIMAKILLLERGGVKERDRKLTAKTALDGFINGEYLLTITPFSELT
jgi:hypothetical protein